MPGLPRGPVLVAFVSGLLTSVVFFNQLQSYFDVLGKSVAPPSPPLENVIATASPRLPRRTIDDPVLLPRWRITPETKGRFFAYQTSGGFGNQRLILQWAIVVANAVNRTLVLPMLAPHSEGWAANWHTKAADSISAHMLLDLETLERVVNNGIKVNEGTMGELLSVDNERVWGLPRRSKFRSDAFGSRSLEVFHWGKNNRANFNSADKIRSKWLRNKADVLFWEKSSMWICCASPLHSWYRRHVTFNRKLKRLVLDLLAPLGPFNAVHVRRGDKSDRAEILERKTPELYYKYHRLHTFNKSMPLYIATDEKDRGWFDAWKASKGAHRGFREGGLVFFFWSDLDVRDLNREVARFPKRMQGDVLGFIEQLICANAAR